MLAYRDSNPEPDSVYVELVSALFLVLWPTLIMAMIFMTVAALTYATSMGMVAVSAASIGLAGVGASAIKLFLLYAFRSQRPQRARTVAQVRQWERGYAYCTWVFSIAVGGLAALNLSRPSAVSQSLAAALMFGYCAGVIVRGLVRPRMCMVSLLLAAVPVVAAEVLLGGAEHYLVAAIYAVFLLGSFESVWSGYKVAAGQIIQRDDMASVARHDVLTGLANRLGLRENFDRIMKSIDNDDVRLAVHCLDLDRFKPVNDRFGHPAGDELLRQIAERIRSVIGPGDVAARTGGDEFVVVQRAVRSHHEVNLYSQRLCHVICAAYTAKGHVITVGVSAGCAVASPINTTLDGLIAIADEALLRAKGGDRKGSAMVGGNHNPA